MEEFVRTNAGRTVIYNYINGQFSFEGTGAVKLIARPDIKIEVYEDKLIIKFKFNFRMEILINFADSEAYLPEEKLIFERLQYKVIRYISEGINEDFYHVMGYLCSTIHAALSDVNELKLRPPTADKINLYLGNEDKFCYVKSV